LKSLPDYDKGQGDEHLVRRALEGEQAALEALFSQYRPMSITRR